jgi:hypothetical protein
MRLTLFAVGVCHRADWSSCEYSCGGNATDSFWYCVFVVGNSSGPVFATIAAGCWAG